MNRIGLILIVAIVAFLAAVGLALQAKAEPPYSKTLTSFAKVVPERATSMNGSTFVAGGTNVQGQIISNSAGRLYMVLNQGTNAATAPTHYHGVAANGSSLYYRVPEEKRRGVVLVNSGTNNIAVGIGYAPTNIADGIILNANGGSLALDDKVQDAIYAGTNSVVSAQEY